LFAGKGLQFKPHRCYITLQISCIIHTFSGVGYWSEIFKNFFNRFGAGASG